MRRKIWFGHHLFKDEIPAFFWSGWGKQQGIWQRCEPGSP
jgi:hypothetical protein